MAPSEDPPIHPNSLSPPNPQADDQLEKAIALGVGQVVSSNMEKITTHMDASLSMFSTSITNSINSLKETLAQTTV
ncbi:hypothetical protein EYR38_010049 [Pleurotus pulmonarius]|nr:hypothetical protein EYR38_010049 [Pleurotus pulmonarius]